MNDRTAAETELEDATRTLTGLHDRRSRLLAETSEANTLIEEAQRRRDQAAALLRVTEPEPPLPAYLAELRTRIVKAPQTYNPTNVKEAAPLKV